MIDEIERIKYIHFRVPVSIRGKKEGKPVLYYRYYPKRSPWEPYPRGGKTVCVIKLKDGKEYIGEAICSMADNFCYRTGREIAFDRANEQVLSLMTWSLKEKEDKAIHPKLKLGDKNPKDGNTGSSSTISKPRASLEVQILFEFKNELLPIEERLTIESAVEKLLFFDPQISYANPLLGIKVIGDGVEVYRKTVKNPPINAKEVDDD